MKKITTFILALTLVTGMATPKKAEAGFMLGVAGAISDTRTQQAVLMSSAFALCALSLVTGNFGFFMLDQDTDQSNELMPIVAAQFPYLQDQPVVIESIAKILDAKLKTVDVAELAKGSVEVKLDDAEMASILDLAILDDEQALDLAKNLQ